MSCCNNNKKDCTNKDLPAEEFGDVMSYVLKGLMEVAKTGRIPSLFKNPAADSLATMIVDIVDENRYLRAILGIMRPETVVADDSFTIAFGPRKQYKLTIPVLTPDDRAAVIEDLKAAIVKLAQEPSKESEQLPLFDAK